MRRPRVQPREAWEIDRCGVNWGPVGHPDISAETRAYQEQLERLRRIDADNFDELEQAESDLQKAYAAMETAWLASTPVLAPTSKHSGINGWTLLYAAISLSRAKALPVYWAYRRKRGR